MSELREHKQKAIPESFDNLIMQKLNERVIVFEGYACQEPGITNEELINIKNNLEAELFALIEYLSKKPTGIQAMLMKPGQIAQWDQLKNTHDQTKKEFDTAIKELEKRGIDPKNTSPKDLKESDTTSMALDKFSNDLRKFITLTNKNLEGRSKTLQNYQGILQNTHKTFTDRTSQFSKMVASCEALQKMPLDAGTQKALQFKINNLLENLTLLFKDITNKFTGTEWQPLLNLLHKKMIQAHKAGLFEIIPVNIQIERNSWRDALRGAGAPKLPQEALHTLRVAADFFDAFKQLLEKAPDTIKLKVDSPFMEFVEQHSTQIDRSKIDKPLRQTGSKESPAEDKPGAELNTWHALRRAKSTTSDAEQSSKLSSPPTSGEGPSTVGSFSTPNSSPGSFFQPSPSLSTRNPPSLSNSSAPTGTLLDSSQPDTRNRERNPLLTIP